MSTYPCGMSTCRDARHRSRRATVAAVGGGEVDEGDDVTVTTRRTSPWASDPEQPGRPGGRRWMITAGVVVAVTAATAATAYLVVRASPWRDDGWRYEGLQALQLVTDGRLVCGTGWEERDPSAEPRRPPSSGVPSRLFCLDASTGEERFRRQIDNGLDDLSMAGRTLLLRGDRGLQAYSVDGDPIWDARVEVPRPEAPVVDDVMIAASALNDPQLVGVDLTTGEEMWGVDDDEASALGSPVASDGERFYVSRWSAEEAHVAAVNPESGEELWRSPVRALQPGVEAAVPMDGGRAVALLVEGADNLGRLLVVDTTTGQRRWEVRLPARADLVQVDGALVVTYLREVRGFDREGEELWRTDVRHTPYQVPLPVGPARLLVEGDVVHLVAENRGGGHRVVRIDPSSGRQTEVADDVSGPVRIAGGHLITSEIDRVEGRPLDGGDLDD